MKKSPTTQPSATPFDGADDTRRAPAAPQSSKRNSFDAGLVLAVLTIVGGALLLGWLSHEVLNGNTDAQDQHLFHVLRNPANPADPVGSPAIEEAARDITGLGGYAVLSGLTVAVAIYLGLSGKPFAGLLLIAATTGGLFMMRLMKLVVNRPRPDLVPHLSYVNSSSFPSGHAMLSAVVYLTVGVFLGLLVDNHRIRIFFVSVALLLTLLVGISRVYLGVHYPTDVLGGWIAGVMWAAFCWIIARFLKLRGTI